MSPRVGDILAAIIKLSIDIADSSDVKASWQMVEGIQAMAERAQQVLEEGDTGGTPPSTAVSAPIAAVSSTATHKQAAQLANEMANACLMLDEHCSWQHGEFADAGDVPRAQVMAELTLIREAINRLGWMADRTSELLGGGICKGGADKWLLSPAFNDMTKGGAA